MYVRKNRFSNIVRIIPKVTGALRRYIVLSINIYVHRPNENNNNSNKMCIMTVLFSPISIASFKKIETD